MAGVIQKHGINVICKKIREYQEAIGKPPIICIMGNIAVGKTKLVEVLVRELNCRVSNEVYDEEELSDYYKNPQQNALPIQKVFLKSRFEAWKSEVELRRTGTVTRPIIFDRCIMDDPVLAKAQLYSERMTEEEHTEYLQVLQEYIAILNEPTDFNEIVLPIYLSCPPEECFRRKMKRSNSTDDEIDIDYMKAIHNSYEEMQGYDIMKSKNVATINWRDFGTEAEVEEAINKLINNVTQTKATKAF